MKRLKLVPRLAEPPGKGIGPQLRQAQISPHVGFYVSFPIWNAVRTELSRTHYRASLRSPEDGARHRYINETATQSWSPRALGRRIGTRHFERLAFSP